MCRESSPQNSYYKVTANGEERAYSFRAPAPDNQQDLTFFAWGDTRCNSVGTPGSTEWGLHEHTNNLSVQILAEVNANPNAHTVMLHDGDITHSETVARELVMIKISAKPEERHEVMSVAETFRAKIVDIGDSSMMIEVTGHDEKLSAFIRLMRRYGIMEIVRTGKIVLLRGSQTT